MAKKKSAKKTVQTPEYRAEMDTAFNASLEQAVTKRGVDMDVVGDPASLPCLPFPSLLLRYLFKLEGLPLSRIYQFRGARGSYKSTFGVEIARWHRIFGGWGARIDTEHKANQTLADMLLGHDSAWFRTYPAESVEQWQGLATDYYKGAQKFCNGRNGPDNSVLGRTRPVVLLVDSLAGSLSERTLKKILDLGHASKRFPEEAASITDYVKAIPKLMRGWPFTFVGINHRKLDLSAAADGIEKWRSPGGDGYGYLMSFSFDLEKVGGLKYFSDYRMARLRFKPDKNSYGPEVGYVDVELRFWEQEDEPDVWRPYCRFEWWAGSIYLLNGEFFNPTQAGLWSDKLREVVDIHEKGSGSLGKLYWSKALGVPSSDPIPANDLGMLLEQRPDLLAAVYSIFGITRTSMFEPGVEFATQLEEYSHVAAQSDAAKQALMKLHGIGAGTAKAPIRRRAGDGGDDGGGDAALD